MLSKRKFLPRNYFDPTFKTVKLKYCTEEAKQAKAIAHAKARKALGARLTVARKLSAYFNSAPRLQPLKASVPTEYLTRKRYNQPPNLYLVDPQIADQALKKIEPILKRTNEHVICETNPGLGLITSRLLSSGTSKVRLYECCPLFRNTLKSLNDTYPGRIELFIRDIFQLGTLSYMDRMDKGERVRRLLEGVPKREWTQDPVMSVIGTMSNLAFVRYLFKMLAFQSEIAAKGRIQVFAFMKCDDFMKITAGPHLSNLRIYQSTSVLFENFFQCELLSQHPREAFLPWENPPTVPSHPNSDYNMMYLVWLKMKKDLPLAPEQIRPYYYFVKHFFSKPSQKIIPTMEKWIPGVGVDIIAPKYAGKKFRSDVNIYTIFGELTPTDVLFLFKIVRDHPSYKSSPLMPMFESQALTSESVQTDLAESAPCPTEDLEEKLLPDDKT